MTTAAIRRLAIPSADELIERARAMAPEIRALAEETERTRNLSPHIVDKIREAELLRTCRPRMFGGFEYDGEVALKIALTISAACASTGWTVNGAVSNGYSLAHWPIEAQRELWEGDADPFTFACFAPTGTAVPVEGGYRLSGQWSFASGCDISRMGQARRDDPPPGERAALEGAFFLLPVERLRDRRQLVCLRPRRHRQQGHRRRGCVRAGASGAAVRRYAGRHLARGAAPRQPDLPLPLLMLGASMLASTAIGAAKGALDAYIDMTTGAQDARRARRRRAAHGGVRDRAVARRRGGGLGRSGRADPADRHAERDAAIARRARRSPSPTASAAGATRPMSTKLAVQAVEALNASTGG